MLTNSLPYQLSPNSEIIVFAQLTSTQAIRPTAFTSAKHACSFATRPLALVRDPARELLTLVPNLFPQDSPYFQFLRIVLFLKSYI